MRVIRLFYLILFFFGSAAGVKASILHKAQVSLYAKCLTVYYDESMNFELPPGFDERSTINFYEAARKADAKALVTTLQHQKRTLHLNDWLYYQLVKNTVDAIYDKRNVNFRVMMQWYLMHESGYFVKLYHDSKRAFLYAAADEKVYGMSFIDMPDGKFCEISSQHYPNYDGATRIYTNTSLPVNREGKKFEFAIRELPAIFSAELIEKQLSFTHNGEQYTLHVKGNKSLISFQRTYPQLGLLSYIDIPVSKTLEESFYEPFEELIRGKDEHEAVRMMMSFTRQALNYRSDNDAYKEGNLNFSPEMTLLAPYSDCEDRAILLSHMVKNLLGLETVLLEYPSHVMVGIKFDQPKGKTVNHNGELYTICEPTGPADELEVGELSSLLASTPFRVYRQ